jgi:hypothetical protein
MFDHSGAIVLAGIVFVIIACLVRGSFRHD